MGEMTDRWRGSVSRRRALAGLATIVAGSPLLHAQRDPFRDHSRVPGMDELIDAFDFEKAAYTKLPREIYDYTAYSGAGEFTKDRNRDAFDWVELVPKGVVNVSRIQTQTELLGTKMAFPILIAPNSGHGQLHPEGEAATYRGATAANTTMIVSNVATLPIDKIAASATGGSLWFQLYPRQQLEANRPILERAQEAGCTGLVVTVDQQSAYYERPRHYRNLVVQPGAAGGRGGGRGGGGGNNADPYRVGGGGRLWYYWKFFEEIRPFFKGPILVKGIVTGEDAALAVKYGLDGVYVSNHGGRTLDYGPSTFEVLPEIVAAVGGRIPVIIDSGFRRGTDILKALALGATAVCIGRPQRWALGAFGAAGVQRIFEILQAELVLAMANTGRPTLASIDRSLVKTDWP